MFPTINYSYPSSYLVNTIQIAASNKKLITSAFFSKRVFLLLKVFKKIKFINFFFIYKPKISKRVMCKICPFYFKNLSIFYKIKIMSKPSKSFFISLKALKLVSSRLDGVIILVSTTRGVITHREAINKSLSGFVFAYFFV